MNVTSIFLGLIILMILILVLRRLRKPRPLITAIQAQRMCPSCGLITSNSKTCCVECGKPFMALMYTISKQ